MYIQQTQNSYLKIATWNVSGSMSSAGSLGKLLEAEDIDIAYITEHKLTRNTETFTSSISKSYNDYTKCSEENNQYGMVKCGKEGVSIMH